MAKVDLGDGRIFDTDTGGVSSSVVPLQPLGDIQPVPEEGPGINWGRLAAEGAGGLLGGSAAAVMAAPTGLLAAPVAVPTGAGLGAEAGGQIYDLFTGSTQGGPIERTADAATNVLLNASGEKGTMMAADAFKRNFGKLIAPVQNRLAGVDADQLLKDYQSMKLQPLAGNVTGNRALQGVDNTLAALPWTSRKYQISIDEALDTISKNKGEIARSVTIPTSREETSNIISRGATDAAKRFSTRLGELDTNVSTMIGEDTPVNLNNVKSTLASLKAQLEEAPNTRGYLNKAIQNLQGVVDDAGDGGALSYRAIRDARTDLGSRLDSPDISGYVGKEPAAVKRAYNALRDDLMGAAELAGDDVLKAQKLHDRYARSYFNTREEVIKTGAKRADKAYKWLMEGSADTGARLRKMRNNLKPEEWDSVVSTTIDRMGRAKPGVQNVEGDIFSPATFLTDWNKMSAGAKRELFGRHKEVMPAMERLARISGSIKDSASSRNTSNTAIGSFFIDLITNPISSLASIATLGGGPRALSAGMRNPQFIDWLVKGAQISPTNPNAIKAHIGRMVGSELGRQLGFTGTSTAEQQRQEQTMPPYNLGLE